jgi:hypothetical protein
MCFKIPIFRVDWRWWQSSANRSPRFSLLTWENTGKLVELCDPVITNQALHLYIVSCATSIRGTLSGEKVVTSKNFGKSQSDSAPGSQYIDVYQIGNLEELIMSTAGIVTMFLGALMVATRAPLIFTPRKALAALRFVFYTETRTRLLGGVITTIEIPMIWAGLTENSDLAGFLLVFGIFILMITILVLVIFPQAYMGLVESLMPKETDTNLFGWRLLGVVAVIVGTAIFNVGFNAL